MMYTSPSQEIGVPIPNIPHAVSVTLPTWEATVGYEEGENWVVSKMNSGYPRFFIHPIIQELCRKIEYKYGREGERCMVYPSYKVAKRCREFIKSKSESPSVKVRVLQLSTPSPKTEEEKSMIVEASIGVVFFQADVYHLAKNYWQHSGEGISSRMGEYILNELFEKEKDQGPHSRRSSMMKSELQAQKIQSRSPSISANRSHSNSRNGNSNGVVDELDKELDTFIEQKHGRVLDLKFATEAKRALRRRICGKADKSKNQMEEMEKAKRGKYLSETDVYLFPSGMASIFYAHHALLKTSKQVKKSVCFGFPYVDTLNILKKFGAGCYFLGMGDDESLEELERELAAGEIDIMALFCECPSNPLLKTPNLKKIRQLADQYNFAVVVDETVGNFLNIHVLPYADMVASSLTKVFSGDSNVLAGSLILNPLSSYYPTLKKFFNEEYEDLFWAEDALWLERNSRDFASRVHKIDQTAEQVVELLSQSPLISKVYYPSLSASKKHYDDIKTHNGGYGGLISFLFHDPDEAVKFFNAVNLHKGPSLGTNFTLACPYAILAHYQELEEIAQWEVDRNLIRISIGLEDPVDLLQVLKKSLDAC
ncbi:STR2 [[Candida] subhashii]|uniref:cystathionine gamma-synthase n=1 Tax=[Candida] subhashii TaxID=561895 RepID=A0A8J5UJS5_9ASCO|nr:STR2 [[Candida] subhashii]KAG7661411.1 STR2 [[Candida] subhashii]